MALLFERPSTRTRVSFEVGVHELGGQPLALTGGDMQSSRGESPRDTALVLSRYGAPDRGADRARTRSSRRWPSTPRCRS